MVRRGDFRLGDWLVSPRLDRISQEGRHVNLQPQVMDLLVYLANRYDQVVSSEELLSELWKDRVVTSASVYSGLTQLRAALGDDVNDPRYIQTIPRRGYRLRVQPEYIESGPAGRSVPGQDVPAASKGSRKWRIVALLAIVVVVASSAFYLYQDRSPLPTEARKTTAVESSIAVLPFVDMSPDQDNGWFSDGMAEEILNKLAQLPGLKVTGRQSSFAFRGSDLGTNTIGRELGVAHLLEGSVRRNGSRVRVTAQLIRADDGFHVWSQEYDRDVVDSIAIQDDISNMIASVLPVKLTAGKNPPGASFSHAIVPSFSAYELYLQALSLIDQNTKRSLMTARDRLEKTLALEPEYAEAHVAMARVYMALANFDGYYREDNWEEPRTLARPHVEKAVEINPNLGGAHAILGHLSADKEYRARAFNKALSLNPNLFQVHMDLGIAVMDQLRPWNDSLLHLDRALEIEPFSVEAAAMLVLFLQRYPPRWQEAENILANLLARHPDSVDVKRAWAEWLMFVLGQPGEAVPLFQEIIALHPDNLWARAWLNTAWYILGETDRAKESKFHSPHWRYVLEADREEALRQLEVSPEWNAEIDFGRRLVFAYTHVMLRNWQGVVDLLAEQAQDLEQFAESSYVQNMGLNECPALSLAVAYKNLGDEAGFRKYAEFANKAILIRTDNGKIRNEEYTRAMARLNALEGRKYEAIIELEHLLLTGSIDPRDLLHPAFDDMRDDPEFERLKQLQLKRINTEREKIGLAPLPV